MKPEADRPAARATLLGIDLSGSADDPLASRARALLASRLTSLLVALITVTIGGALIAEDWADLLAAALIATGIIRLVLLFLAKDRRSAAFAINNIGGALLVALGLYDIGSAGGLDVWAMLVIGVPPLTMGRHDGARRRTVYAICVAIVVAAEVLARFIPPHAALPAHVLAGWRLVNFAGAAIVLVALTMVYRKTLERAERQVAEQQQVSERLLTNILPAPIAERLKRDEYPIADAHKAVTVMFADGVNFSEFAANNKPETVVELLNIIVYAFDDMALRRGVEKIKTIGDAYMVAGGLTEERGGGAATIAELAFEMLDFVHDLGRRIGLGIDLRIGIHTGPLVAGVIGKHKFSYDVWGDTVNIAAHLESAGEPGRVHISEATARALGPGWRVEPRAPIVLKGAGTVSTCFLLGPAPAAAAAASIAAQ
ncbi:MAG TPA: adenylate/guanylate cyclase domain-containing protein [Stellaceae bacterium]|nr:adenylate/guanylate cyclase domain-containing protein [Stellaceae bacterium]